MDEPSFKPRDMVKIAGLPNPPLVFSHLLKADQVGPRLAVCFTVDANRVYRRVVVPVELLVPSKEPAKREGNPPPAGGHPH